MLDLENELKKIEKLKNSLEKKDVDLIISDFDYTIFSRKEQLEKSDILRDNRGDLGNEMILGNIGLSNYINDFYVGKTYPNTIVKNFRKNHDLILTAGYKEIQDEKMKATGLDKYNYIVVKEAYMKIYETIRYVIKDLGFIPNKITVYEDRPDFFIENKSIIENFLGTKLEIMFVEMSDNYTEPNIKKIS